MTFWIFFKRLMHYAYTETSSVKDNVPILLFARTLQRRFCTILPMNMKP